MTNNPVTDAELDQFYGVAPSEYERDQAISDAKRGYDASDLSNDAYDCFEAINAALEDGDEMEAGRLLQAARQATIARQASRLAYGIDKPHALTLEHVFGPSLKALGALTIRG
jgi:hypothetical protein